MRSYLSTPLSWPGPNSGFGKVRQQLLQLIRNQTRLVVPSRLTQITIDPADNIFLECADAARADYVITGNKRHFPRFWKNTKVINSREVLNIIAPHLTE
jgi:predicted nucleic acid-binding protein